MEIWKCGLSGLIWPWRVNLLKPGPFQILIISANQFSYYLRFFKFWSVSMETVKSRFLSADTWKLMWLKGYGSVIYCFMFSWTEYTRLTWLERFFQLKNLSQILLPVVTTTHNRTRLTIGGVFNRATDPRYMHKDFAPPDVIRAQHYSMWVVTDVMCFNDKSDMTVAHKNGRISLNFGPILKRKCVPETAESALNRNQITFYLPIGQNG